MEESTATATAASTVRRVFDCCLFNGEMDVLAIRFHELNAVVDHFVIVESTLTFSGLPQEISFNPCHPSIAPLRGQGAAHNPRGHAGNQRPLGAGGVAA